jgi:hypothetical protein
VDEEEAVRLAALMGVSEGPGSLLIRGPDARLAGRVSRLVEGIEVVALDPNQIGADETQGVSRIVSGSRLPFFSDSFRAVLLSGEVTGHDLDEAVRVTAPLGRVVTLQTSSRVQQRVEALGLTVLLQEEGVLVCRKGASDSLPLVTLRGS